VQPQQAVVNEDAGEPVADRPVEGLAEMLRSESAKHTPLAWLSRAEVVQLDGMLVFALPGSPRAAQQCMDMLQPLLAHALAVGPGVNPFGDEVRELIGEWWAEGRCVEVTPEGAPESPAPDPTGGDATSG